MCKVGVINIHNSNIINHKATDGGGAMYITSNSNVNILRTIIKNNHVTTTATDNSNSGGGAINIHSHNSITIRETSFISNIATNNRGNEILTYGSSAAFISIINTNFNNANTDTNMFYESNGNAVWKTCSSA